MAATVAIAIIAIISAAMTGSTNSQAASYIKANGRDLFTVENSVGALEGRLRSNDVAGISGAAMAAHRIISNVTNDLESYSGKWSDSTDASDVIEATQSLATVTRAIVTWTNTPTEAGLAAEITEVWAADSVEWNSAVNAVWRAAHERNAPTVS